MADDDRRWRSGSDEPDAGSHLSGKQIGAAVLAFLLLVFVLQNTDTTSITLLVFDVSFPLWLVLAATIVLSVGIGYLLGSRRRRRD